MRGWFPRHWKCRLVSEIGGKLSGIESLYLLPYHLTTLQLLRLFLCIRMVLGYIGCAVPLNFLLLFKRAESLALVFIIIYCGSWPWKSCPCAGALELMLIWKALFCWIAILFAGVGEKHLVEEFLTASANKKIRTNKNTFCNSIVEEEFLTVTLVLTSITSYQMFWIWKGTIH